jgi:uncharacterized protein (DUF433 family)
MILVVQTGTSLQHSSQVIRLAAELPGVLRRVPRQEDRRQRRGQRRLTPEQVTQLVGEYQAGGRVKDLATSWRVHRDTVSRLLRETGVEPRFEGITGAQVSEAVRLYGEGWSIRRLAARYDRSYEMVRRALLRAGARLRPKNGEQSTELP